MVIKPDLAPNFQACLNYTTLKNSIQYPQNTAQFS